MSYEVLARKWRPKQFDEVVGQDHVTRTLKNAVTAGRIASAYVFVGPRGIGKTSIARIFAKALDCEKGPSVTPCDACDACREIAEGRSLDVLEIDGASNNGVEQVRELRETVSYAPSRGPYKIYIIDEVHMLSTSAFNALLKTLEEPPPHVKFLFATTEPEKILATILSRCQRFDLRRISVPLIVARLQEIAESEKVKIEPDALLAIARGAEGGLRDAESALDQLISFKGSDIKEEDVLSIFGLVARSVLEELAENLLRGNIREIIRIVAELDNAGKNLQRLVVELMEHFRNVLVCLHVENIGEGLDLTDAQIESLRRQASITDTERTLRIVDILSETDAKMRYALSRRTLLETALIRCARSAVVASLQEILEEVRHLKGGEGGTPPPRTPAKGKSPARTTNAEAEKAGTGHGGEGRKEVESVDAAEDLSLLRSKWSEISQNLGKLVVGLKRVLDDALPVQVTAEKVVIAFDPEFAEGRKKFDSARNRKAVEHILGSLVKRNVKVEFVVARDNFSTEETKASDDAPEKKSSAGKKKGRRTVRQWEKDPAVRKVMETFNGSIVDIRD